MSKAILFNAPAKAGKDYAITHLKNVGFPLIVREAKDHLHKLTQLFFRVNEDRYWQIYNDRSLKETGLPEFRIHLAIEDYDLLSDILGNLRHWHHGWRNLSIREAMIYVSEVLCKPRFGNDYFGAARANSVRHAEVVVDGSTGFMEELPPLIDKLGQGNILLIRVHREGCTFEGDSRNYIPDGVITNTVDIINNGTLDDYYTQVENVVDEFLGGNIE